MTDSTLAFSRDEYTRRLAALRRTMRERDAEIVLVDEADHFCYLTGFDRSATRYQVCAIPLEGDPVMFLRSLDEPSFLERPWLSDHVLVADWEDPVDVMATALAPRGWTDRRIGLELDSNHLTVRRGQAITTALPHRYDNATGYTLGYYAPWSPRTNDFTRLLVPTATWVLEPGRVFHMYVPAQGLAFSETVVVTDDGADRLTRSARVLFVR